MSARRRRARRAKWRPDADPAHRARAEAVTRELSERIVREAHARGERPPAQVEFLLRECACCGELHAVAWRELGEVEPGPELHVSEGPKLPSWGPRT